MTFVECNPLVFAAQGALLGTEKVAVKERKSERKLGTRGRALTPLRVAVGERVLHALQLPRC